MNTIKFFDNVKDGDILFFWRKGLFSYIIRLYQKLNRKNNLNKINHCGVVYNPIKTENSLTFYLSHQTINGGYFDYYQIRKELLKDGGYQYIIESDYNGYTDIRNFLNYYWLNLEIPFTKREKERGLEDAYNQVGKTYGYITLFTYIPIIGILLDKIYKYLFKRKMRRICSSHVLINHLKAGRTINNIVRDNPYPTPEFLAAYNKDDLQGDIIEINF